MSIAAVFSLTGASLPYRCCDLALNQKLIYRVILKDQKKVNYSPLAFGSLLKRNGDNRSNCSRLVVKFGSKSDVVTEPPDSAKMLPERLFSKIQKLEEMLSKDTIQLDDADLAKILEVLEPGLEVILSASGEGTLKEAPSSPMRKDLHQQEEEIAAATTKQNEMEEDLKKAKSDLSCQFKQISDLKLLVEMQQKEITSSQSLLSQRENEVDKLMDELTKKNKELESKEHIIHEANKIINDQETKIMSYSEDLEVAQLQSETEISNLRAASARCKELEVQSSDDKAVVELLVQELIRERASLMQKSKIIEILENELEKEKAKHPIHANECELSEVDLLIQKMAILVAECFQYLQEEDAALNITEEELIHVRDNLSKLQCVLESKNESLNMTTTRLREKEAHIQNLLLELEEAKQKVSEAAPAVEQHPQLADQLADSAKFEAEAQLEMVKRSLREKEMEVVAAQISLFAKEEELKSVIIRWEKREVELDKLKEELWVEDGSAGDLVAEKLQLKAAVLEAEAVTGLLELVSEMTHELVRSAQTFFDINSDVFVPPTEVVQENEYMEMAKREVRQLSALTEQLVKGIGIYEQQLRLQQGCDDNHF